MTISETPKMGASEEKKMSVVGVVLAVNASLV